jgi:hypothetical protein
MRHPRIIIGGIGLTGQGFQNFFVATPGLAPITAAAARTGTAPAAPASGYGY